MSVLLGVSDAHIAYGKVEAVRGVSLEVGGNEIITIIGANGAGKTTLLNAIMGVLPLKGRVDFSGEDMARLEIEDRVALGISLVPEHRALFATMSVEDNLQLGAFRVAKATAAQSFERVYTLFPRLQERRRQLAGTLSGGEQQMLAMGRALMGAPRLLMLDEPSLGLAPIIVADIFRTIGELRAAGVSVLLVEQNAQAALKLEPAMKADKPAADQKKFMADYQADMKKFIGLVEKTEAALKAGNNAVGPPVPVGADGKASLTWRAGVNPPTCTPVPCGGFPFDTKDDGNRSTYNNVFAEYITGGTSLLQNACSGTNGWQQNNCFETNVDIDPAAATVSITRLVTGSSGSSCDGLGASSPVTAGQCITVTATVTGVPDFPPTGGNVIFRAVGGSLLSDSGTIGNGFVTETPVGSGIFIASVNFVTGNAGSPMDTPGSYNLTAAFQGTSALDAATSSNFAVTVDKEAASVTLTLPGGSTLSAGGTGTAHVVITSSNSGFLDNNNATVDLLDGTTVLLSHNLTNAEAGTFDFQLSSVPVGTYSLTARYNGNNYYTAATSSPALPLTINKSNATISLTNLTRTTDAAPNGDSVGDHFTIRANVNSGQSPSAAGGLITLKATILGVTTTLATYTLVGSDNGQHTFSLDTSSGVLLTTDPISLSIDYGGNSVLNDARPTIAPSTSVQRLPSAPRTKPADASPTP